VQLDHRQRDERHRMFTVVQSNVIRVWVYRAQDASFGVQPGVEPSFGCGDANPTFDGK